MPFILEQPEVVFVLETVTEGVTLAQVSFIGKAKLEQQASGGLIGHIDDRLNTMQAKLSKSIGQDGRHGFGHDALSPKTAIKFIARFGAMKARAEVMETARSDHAIFTLERDAPADDLAPDIARLDLFDQFLGLVYRLVRLMAIELHGFLIRQHCKEVLGIPRPDLPKEQAARAERRKVSKCCIDDHTQAPLLKHVI